MDYDVEKTKLILSSSLKIIRMYEWLLDLYVLDFFVDDHWQKLPNSWRECLQNMDPRDLGKMLLGESQLLLPLSLMSLIKAVNVYSISRKPLHVSNNIPDRCPPAEVDLKCGNHPRLKNLFLKHVKLKKRHEINCMAEVVDSVATESGCRAVLDFGSGVGHLVRVLSYKHDMKAAGIERQEQLIVEARKHDNELEYTARKYLSEKVMSELHKPLHLHMTLTCGKQLLDLDLPESMTNFGLVGLHPCGDLGPLLLKHFVLCDRVKFICIVGCCYMKLTCESGKGYPLSTYVKSLDSNLSYASREISCHAIEVYCDRLKRGQYEDLKVHAYRAALECILVGMDPKLRHAQVRSIKHSKEMTFERYSNLALERLNLGKPSPSALSTCEVYVGRWRRVVAVYSMRLALAPLIETVVLLDRVLYLLENGLSCEIQPVFDPRISPRNHIIVARR